MHKGRSPNLSSYSCIFDETSTIRHPMIDKTPSSDWFAKGQDSRKNAEKKKEGKNRSTGITAAASLKVFAVVPPSIRMAQKKTLYTFLEQSPPWKLLTTATLESCLQVRC